MPTLTIEYDTDAERLQYERAIAYVQELNRVGADAAPGTVLDACEGFALDRGRRLLATPSPTPFRPARCATSAVAILHRLKQ